MTKIKLGFQILESAHRTRGIGFYAKNLLENLTKIPDLEIIQFSDLSKLEDVDLVHYPTFDLFSATLPLRKKFPTVVTIHDVIPLNFPEHYPPGVKGVINNFWQKLSLKSVSAVITVSNTSKEDISVKLGVPKGKITVVHSAAGNEYKEVKDLKSLEKFRNKFNLPKEFALYTGSVNWNKNLVGLTKASLEAGVDLVLVGKNFEDKNDLNHPERRSYKEFLEKYGENPKIHTLGFVSTDELVALYNLAAVTLLPSFYEGFGFPVLESQACSTPVITSNTSCLPEVAGEGAIFVDPYNIGQIREAIKKISEDKNLREELVKKGFENIKRFSWGKTAQETFQVYQKVLNK